jgi:hypothetical protein
MRKENMRTLFALLTLILTTAVAEAATTAPAVLGSPEGALRWINNYRSKPDPDLVAPVIVGLSRTGVFKDAETAGVYVGFVAGVMAANPGKAEALIRKLLALPSSDHWIIVRAIAYSGYPEWEKLLTEFQPNMPDRKVMIERYLTGKLPTLWLVTSKKSASTWEMLRTHTVDRLNGAAPAHEVVLEATPDLLDTFWGYYFGTGSRRPLGRIIGLLPLARDTESVEKLTMGSMAKYTLATNAAKDPDLLLQLKNSVQYTSADAVPILNAVIEAAETVETGRLRREALAAIEELRRKGPGSRRDVGLWGQIGQGALAVGCIAAAATGQVEFGIPCVVTGGLSSAALTYWNSSQ